MKHTFGKVVVIGLGGSVIYPNEHLDVLFLKKFKRFVVQRLRGGRRFIIVAGGGRLARHYIDVAAKMCDLTDEDKDWLGIHATRLNAHLLRAMFRDVADPTVIDKRQKITKLTHPVTVASGWRPGNSTDFVAVQIAFDFGVSEVVAAGKPAYVYAMNGGKMDEGEPIESLSWHALRKLLPRAWEPGLHSPIDPVAARLAERTGVSVVVAKGTDLKNLGDLLVGKKFRGTVIG